MRNSSLRFAILFGMALLVVGALLVRQKRTKDNRDRLIDTRCSSPIWSKDGLSLFYVKDSRIVRYDVTTAEKTEYPWPVPFRLNDVSTDGHHAVLASEYEAPTGHRRRIVVLNLTNGTLRTLYDGGMYVDTSNIYWAGSDSVVCSASEGRQMASICILSLRPPNVRRIVERGAIVARTFGGKGVLYSTDDFRYHYLDLASETTQPINFSSQRDPRAGLQFFFLSERGAVYTQEMLGRVETVDFSTGAVQPVTLQELRDADALSPTSGTYFRMVDESEVFLGSAKPNELHVLKMQPDVAALLRSFCRPRSPSTRVGSAPRCSAFPSMWMTPLLEIILSTHVDQS